MCHGAGCPLSSQPKSDADYADRRGKKKKSAFISEMRVKCIGRSFRAEGEESRPWQVEILRCAQDDKHSPRITRIDADKKKKSASISYIRVKSLPKKESAFISG